jgi:DNA mismatch repair protein MutH
MTSSLLLLLLIGALLVHLVKSAGSADSDDPSICRVQLGSVPLQTRNATHRPRNVGFLIGVGPATPDDAITQLAPHVRTRRISQ